MNEEILRIQKMVAEGKITPEESVELLESVGMESARSADPKPPVCPMTEKDAGAKKNGFLSLWPLLITCCAGAIVGVVSSRNNDPAAILWFVFGGLSAMAAIWTAQKKRGCKP